VGGGEERVAVDATSEIDEALLGRYIRAWEALDLPALVALLHDDITASMPPSPTWLRGKAATVAFLAARPFAVLARSTLRIVPLAANGQPALAFYVGGALHAVHVVRVRERRIVELHHFCDEASLAAFKLPRSIGGDMTSTEGRRSAGPQGTDRKRDGARAVADLAEGVILAAVEVDAPRERVFRAMTSEEITRWWVRPGVFDTTEWVGDVRPGGRWRAAGRGRGQPYVLEGEFLEVDAPRRFVHTWHRFEAPGAPTTVTVLLEALDAGTRVTLRHAGFTSREGCASTCIGWETSLEQLAAHLR
jgi:uncharacterized protein YndB with AHSA1/START domain